MRTLILAGLVAAALPAMAWSKPALTPLERLFPAGAFRVTVAQDLIGEGVRTYHGVAARGEAADIGIEELAISALDGGDIAVRVTAMTVRPRDPAAPVFSVSGLALQLSDWPNAAAADPVCQWLSILEKAEIKAGEMQVPGEDGPSASVRIRSFGFQEKGTKDGCRISGVLDAGEIELMSTGGVSAAITGARAQVNLPADLATAESDLPAGVRVAVSEIEFRNTGEIPAVGAANVDISSEVVSSGLQGAIRVLRSGRLFSPEGSGQLALMEALNALTLIEGRLTAAAPVTRIYSPGVVPKEAIANFSRVGLSTVTGASGFSLFMKGGAMRLEADMALNGLAEMDLVTTMVLRPYPKQKLELAAAGGDLGFHLIPDLRLVEGQFGYEDRGLDSYVVDLTGVPTGRYIHEIGTMLLAAYPERIRHPAGVALEELTTFFRFAAEGIVMRLFLRPETPVSASELTLLAVTDAMRLADRLGLMLTRSDPAD
ncbi:hypothetical protein [Defluviimonas salinarum]|uniref:Dicarboxylate transport n=1 Tax=Defluviimonas salinarum TaxID=2992147 RepID=A0ABT3J4D7_9RHOB|nr:hypothetical protein [Defluviimonas salinarum]MCW3782556.1 hypothetical protein [Defluviimonas salinarum]